MNKELIGMGPAYKSQEDFRPSRHPMFPTFVGLIYLTVGFPLVRSASGRHTSARTSSSLWGTLQDGAGIEEA